MKYKTKCEILQLLLWLVYVLKIEKEKREMGNLFQKIGKCESENMCTREIDWFVIVPQSKIQIYIKIIILHNLKIMLNNVMNKPT